MLIRLIEFAGLLAVATLFAQTPSAPAAEEPGPGRKAMNEVIRRVAALDSEALPALTTAASMAGQQDPMLILLKLADSTTREGLLSPVSPGMRARVEKMMAELGEPDDQQLAAAAEALTPLLEPVTLACAQAFGLYLHKQYPVAAQKYEAAFKLGTAGNIDYYNAGCTWALAGNKDAAFRNLNEAITRGWRELDQLEQDEDLVSLRKDKRWKQIIGRIEKENALRVAALPDEHKPLSTVKLPAPELKGSVSVEEALAARRSVRQYAASPLTLKEVSQVLWAAYGITAPEPDVPFMRGGMRTAPSAGALYPLDIYLFAGNVTDLPAGIYYYNSAAHELWLIAEGDQRTRLYEAGAQQTWIKEAPASLVFSAIFERTTKKYGARGRERYVCMDLGHSGENVYLQCGALGLGTVALGAFTDAEVRFATGMTKTEEPLYIMPVGRLPAKR
jgi:SagB-type dehydrogenase family enzyme